MSRSKKEREERLRRQSGAAIAERVREAHRLAEVHRQAIRLAAEQQKAEEELKKDVGSQSRQQQRGIEQKRRKLERRTFRLLERNDDSVRQILVGEHRLDHIMSAEEATEGDELLWFVIEELELLSALESLRPPPKRTPAKTGKEIICRTMYQPEALNVLGIMSRFAGAATGPDVQTTVLCDTRWMRLFGFNATEVESGYTKRSSSLIGKTRQGTGGQFTEAGPLGPARARLEGPRGALSWQTLADHESRLQAEKLVETFNAVVRALAARGYFPKTARVAIDSTAEEVVPSFDGAGRVRKKVKAQSKARRPRQIEVTVLGFKAWFVMEVTTGIPVAMTLDTIEKAETDPARKLFDQARQNLEGHSTIVSAALDRGFIDGDLFWWLKVEQQINWVCPSKENMLVTAEARKRVQEAIEALAAQGEAPLATAQRAARGSLVHNKVQFFERAAAPGRETLVVAQVDELLCTEFYGPGGSTSGRVHSKKYKPTPLHATVVLRWPDRNAKDFLDAQENDPASKGPVVLLSPVMEPALVRYDRYDERSLIENRLNRDGKQHFGLGRSLARNAAAIWSATVFSTLALMLYRGLDLHWENLEALPDRRAENLGVMRYRRQVKLLNYGKAIIAVDGYCGLIPLTEFARMAGYA